MGLFQSLVFLTAAVHTINGAIAGPESQFNLAANDTIGHDPGEDDDCDCYVISGPDPGHFEHYRFYDFRSHNGTYSNGYSVMDGDDSLVPRAVETLSTDKDDASTTKTPRFDPSLLGTPFIDDWAIQVWHRGGDTQQFPIRIINSHENIYIANDGHTGENATSLSSSSHLVLRTIRLENHTSTAEVETRENNILHCSLRVRLRLYTLSSDSSIDDDDPENTTTISESLRRNSSYSIHTPPARGAVAGIFTYFSSHSESDIEILTSDPPDTIHYTNQPDWDPATGQEIPGASDTVTLPTPWTSWATHRLDWFPTVSRWYLDDEVHLEKTYGVPTRPSTMVLNLWSDGGLWSGNMSVGASVYMGIEWIQAAYNTSDIIVAGEGDDGEDEDEDWMYRRPRPRPLSNHGGGSAGGRGNGKSGDTKDKANDTTKERKGCMRVCHIDDVETVGVPEVLSSPLVG